MPPAAFPWREEVAKLCGDCVLITLSSEGDTWDPQGQGRGFKTCELTDTSNPTVALNPRFCLECVRLGGWKVSFDYPAFNFKHYSLLPYKRWGTVAELTCHLQASTPYGIRFSHKTYRPSPTKDLTYKDPPLTRGPLVGGYTVMDK
jgi:hypothetical protein